MGLNSVNSDYGSGSSMNSSTSWGSQELDWQTFQSQLLNPERPKTKAASFTDLVNGRCTIEDVMQEFRRNGFDAPYSPDDDQHWTRNPEMSVSGVPSVPAYLRQSSWPAPDRTPAQRLPRPHPAPLAPPVPTVPTVPLLPPLSYALDSDMLVLDNNPPRSAADSLTPEQRSVLSSLSDAALLTVLRDLRRGCRKQPEECRFCKNNGEAESYCRSHALKDGAGRVTCPVLRAFVCKRCGARGDTAHTIKYCPLTTAEERNLSAAMMRSVRMGSTRRRHTTPPSSGGVENYVVFGETPRALVQDAYIARQQRAPLHPKWAALEKKLML